MTPNFDHEQLVEYKLTQLGSDVRDLAEEVKGQGERIDRILLVFFSIFGALLVFALGTAITLLTLKVGSGGS